MAYRQGVGPDRLPQGAAQQVNANQTPESAFGAYALENQQIPVQYSSPDAGTVPNEPAAGSDERDILLAHPNPNYEAPVIPRTRGRIPTYVVRHIAQLQAAATAPDAPPTLRALYNATIRQLDDQYRQGR